MNKKLPKKLLAIAMEWSIQVKERGDLEKRNSDSEDFLDVSVWGLKAMLQEAYELGKQHGQR